MFKHDYQVLESSHCYQEDQFAWIHIKPVSVAQMVRLVINFKVTDTYLRYKLSKHLFMGSSSNDGNNNSITTTTLDLFDYLNKVEGSNNSELESSLGKLSRMLA